MSDKTPDPAAPQPERAPGERTRLEVHGQEMLRRRVSRSGGCGRVYLPRSWKGKRVKIIRLD